MPVLRAGLSSQPDQDPTHGSKRLALLPLTLLLLAFGFGGCAQRPEEVAVASHGREYFPSSIYGAASRRVIADGQPIPRGGGQYLVGKPYTIAGRTYYPSESRKVQVGNASWYGDAFHGRLTANGEVYDRDGFTAASPTMPLPSYARVTNLRNNYSMIVRVNDRGPYASNRIMDVSRRVAESLDFKRYGTARIKVEYVARASLAGSDDAKLYATLRTNGPARWDGEPTMVAESQPPRARVASLAAYAPAPERVEAVAPEPQPVRHAPRLAEARPPRRQPMVDAEVAAPDRRVSRHRELVAVEPGSRWRHERMAENEEPAVVDAPMPARSVRPRFVEQRYGAPEFVPPPRPRLARSFQEAPAIRAARVPQASPHRSILPPSRPMDLGTSPGAASQIRARRDMPRLRLARARDD